jgi:hypothetical protein
VSGTAYLGGTLNLSLLGTAYPGTTLDVLPYGSRSGGFANVYVPSGWTWYYDDSSPPDGVYGQLTYNGPPH